MNSKFDAHLVCLDIYVQSQTGQILLCLFQQILHCNAKCYSHGVQVSGD